MLAPINQEALQEKWAPILDHDGLGEIKDNHRRMVTAVLLENQENAIKEEREFLSEQPTNSTGSSGATAGFSASAAQGGPTAGFDPVLISLIHVYKRQLPSPLVMLTLLILRSVPVTLLTKVHQLVNWLVSVLSLSAVTTLAFLTQRVHRLRNSIQLVVVEIRKTLKHLVLLTKYSTRWHSRSRRSPLQRNPVL